MGAVIVNIYRSSKSLRKLEERFVDKYLINMHAKFRADPIIGSCVKLKHDFYLLPYTARGGHFGSHDQLF